MKTAVLYGERDVKLEERDVPDVGGDDVLVQVKACGICPTDVRKYTGKSGAKLPLVLGHEPAGDVAAVGPDVRSVREGDRVCMMPWWPCGYCSTCRVGRFIECPNVKSIGGSVEHSLMIDGAFSEYVRVPERAVVVLGDAVSYEAATFGDPLAAAVNSIERCRIPLGGDVVILGAGPLGMMHLQLAKVRGARVIVSDVNEERLELARRFGAHETLDPSKEDAVAAVRELTDGEGAGAVIVAVGNKQAEEQGIAMLANNGVLSIFAGTYPATTIEMDPNDIHYGEKVITGAFAFSPEQFVRTVKLLDKGIVDVEALITHRLALEELSEGLEMTIDGIGMKKMVLP
jgi:L-iditol 2-dehydrogenase